METTVRKITFLERLKILFMRDLMVSTNKQMVLAIGEDTNTKGFLESQDMTIEMYKSFEKNLQTKLASAVIEINDLQNDITKLNSDIVGIKQASRVICSNNDKFIEDIKLKNKVIRRENFRLTKLLENCDDKISKIKKVFEDRLYRKREANRELEIEIESVRSFGVSEASEELKKLSRIVSGRKLNPFKKAVKALEHEIDELRERLVKCESAK